MAEVVQRRKPGPKPKVKVETDTELRRAQTTSEQLNAQFADNKTVEKTADKTATKTVEGIKDSDLWREAMLAVMGAYQAKTPSTVRACIPAAEEYVKIFKERFK